MDKRAQGLSLNTIIIGLIVLVVLVIIIAVTTGFFGNVFTPAVSTGCTNAPGKCVQAHGSAPVCGKDAFGNELAEITQYKDECKEKRATGICCPVASTRPLLQ